MDFAESQEQRMIRETVQDICSEYDTDYFREHVEEQEFPQDHWDELANAGLVGTMIPEEYEGAGMGMQEMAIVVEELARRGGAGGLSLVLTAIFGGVGITQHGTEEQKEEYLPRIATGDIQFCMGLTEANAGVNTLQIDTFAERDGDEFVIDGQKMFISGVDHADGMLLITRTAPFEEAPTDGITLFLVPEPTEQDAIQLTPLDMHVPWYETQYQIDIDGLRVHEDRILGGPDNEGNALINLWDTLNTERISGAAGAVGSGLRAVDLGVEYAKQREVFDGPIGAYQSIQHPLADAYAGLLTAREMAYKAAWKFDNDEPCGAESNISKLKATQAGTRAATHALQAHGGSGYSKDYEIFPLWVNQRLSKTVPIPNEMIKNFIAEHELGLPKSY